LLADPDPERRVSVFDNLASGSRSRLGALGADTRLSLVEADVADLEALCKSAEGVEVRPDIDFREGRRVPGCRRRSTIVASTRICRAQLEWRCWRRKASVSRSDSGVPIS
jgi:hypothetical protein